MAYQYPFKSANSQLISSVWAKGKKISQKSKTWDESVWRWDKCGKVMKFSEHGNRNSEHGWEIDHIVPKAKGGKDDLSNLQPLNWKMNSAKGDSHPWSCPN